MIVGFCGTARSGKDTSADYIVEKYGFKHLSFSQDVLDLELLARGIEITKMNRSRLGDELRKEEGMGSLAKRLAARAKQYKKVVIDNFRSPEEVEFFSNSQDVILIYVDAPLPMRFERRSGIDPQTLDGFRERDDRDAKNKGMEKLFKQAHYKVNNNSKFDELYVQLDKIMAEVLK